MRLDKSPDWLISLFEGAIDGLPIERRKMFGYPAAFANGQMCCGLFGKEFFLRLGEKDRQELLAIEGSSLFDPMGGRPMHEYIVVPYSMLEEQDTLRSWLKRSVGYTQSLPAKPGSGKSTRQSSKRKGAVSTKARIAKRGAKRRVQR